MKAFTGSKMAFCSQSSRDNVRRYQALRDLQLLTSSADLHLETVCKAIAVLFDVPIVLVTLIDQTHVRVKACWGTERHSVARRDAFCDATINGEPGAPFVIRNLLEDLLFRDSPLVVEKPRARFYAGVPLTLATGCAIGTLCLMDVRSRPDFDNAQVERLCDLGRVVEEHFRLMEAHAGHRLEAEAAQNAEIAAEAAASFGRWSMMDATGPVLWSPGIARIFGRPMPPGGRVALAEHVALYHPDNRAAIAKRIADAFAGRRLQADGSYRIRARIVRSDGDIRDVLVDGAASLDPFGCVASLSGVLVDVSDVTRSERKARETSDLLRSTLENMDQGLLMLGPDGRVRIHNRRVRELLDLPEALLFDGAAMDPIRLFLAGRGEYEYADTKARAWSISGLIETEATSYERRRPDGTALEIRAVPLPDGGVVRTFTDVSLRKSVERAVQESEARYRLLADNTTDVIIWSGLDTVRRYVSPASRTVLGYAPDELVGTMPLSFTHPEDADRYAATLRDLCEGRIDNAVSTQRYRRKDGGWVWIEASLSLTRDPSGTATGYVASLRDVTERKSVEEALLDSEERLKLALQSGSDGIWDLNVTTGAVRLSGDWISRLGYGESEVLPFLAAWQSLTHPDDRLRSESLLIRHLKAQTATFECEYRIRTKPGTYVWTLARGRVVARDAKGRALRMVGTHMDITQRKEAELLVAHMALHDALTDLPNRVHFKDRLGQALERARRDGCSFAVLACDLDRFKAVNDMLGHAAGDRILQEVATRLRSVLRDCDTVARLGGDEFAVILGRIHRPQEAANAAERLIRLIEEPTAIEGRSVAVGVSIGIAVGTGGLADAEELFRNADVALFRAKEAGRNTFRFFEAGMDAAVAERNMLEHDMRTAIRRSAFALHYQPVVDLGRRAVGGFEALMRWSHPTRGEVSPAQFIPLAEETGLIVPLGAWALREACAAAATWPGDVRVAVNVSTMQFREDGLEASVATALELSGLAPQRLELEITEGVLVHDAEGVIACLHRLRATGVRIALDDFGTGYSSLSYLRRFPFDKIKIDRSFIREIDDPDTAAIVRAVVGLGVRAGAALTAEGVEDARQLRLVIAEGCTEVQGYLFGKAIVPEQVASLLETGRADIEATIAATSSPRVFAPSFDTPGPAPRQR